MRRAADRPPSTVRSVRMLAVVVSCAGAAVLVGWYATTNEHSGARPGVDSADRGAPRSESDRADPVAPVRRRAPDPSARAEEALAQRPIRSLSEESLTDLVGHLRRRTRHLQGQLEALVASSPEAELQRANLLLHIAIGHAQEDALRRGSYTILEPEERFPAHNEDIVSAILDGIDTDGKALRLGIELRHEDHPGLQRADAYQKASNRGRREAVVRRFNAMGSAEREVAWSSWQQIERELEQIREQRAVATDPLEVLRLERERADLQRRSPVPGGFALDPGTFLLRDVYLDGR